MPAIKAGVRTRRDLLLAVYKGNPKKLTEFGFDVSEGGTGAKPAPKPPASK